MADRIKGLKIVLGADATELINAISKVNTEIKSTQSNLRDINKALKLDPTNINLLKDKQQELTKAVKESKEKLDAEKKALEDMKAQGVSETSKEFQDLKTQIDLDTVAVKDLENQVKDFGTVGAQQLKAVGDKFKDVGSKISDAGQTMTTKVTVPIVAGFGAAIKTAAGFDAQMSKVQAISGSNSDAMAQLEAKAREMGATTRYSAEEAGQALEYMAMAGWKTDQMLSGIDGIMHLAAASGEELGTTSDIVTDALTAFGYKAEDAGRFADILAAASTNANTNVSMLGESFKYAAAPAGALGYSAEDVAIALGLMANSGIKADMAGTSLRNMFQRMAKPTKESAMAMERLGLELYDGEGEMYTFREIMDQLRKGFTEINMPLEEYDAQVAALDAALEDGTLTQKKYDSALEELNLQAFGAEGAEKARAAAMLGGARAMSGLLAIANASEEDYQKLTAAVDGSSESFAKLADGSVVPLSEALASGQEIIEQYNGSAEAMAATMEDNLEGDITKLKSAAQELGISLGQILMPIATKIVEKVQAIVDWLNSLDEGTKKTLLTIAGVVAAVGPVLLVVGKIITGIGALISSIGTISAAITAAIPVISGIAATITGTVIPAIVAVVAPILPIIAAIGAVIAIIVLCVKHWDEIKEAAARAVEHMKNAWLDFKENMTILWDNIKAKVSETVENMIAKWQAFKDGVSQKWQETKNNIVTAATTIWSNVTSKFSEIKNNVVNKVMELKNNAVNAFNNLKSSIASTIGGIYTTIVGGFQNAINFIKSLPSQALNWGKDIINGIISGIKDTIGGIADAIGGVAGTIASFIHFSEPDKGPLADFHTYMPDMMKQLAQGIENGIPMLEDAMSSMTQSMIPSMGGMAGGAGTTSNTTSNNVSINVYGSAGQDVNELAQIIEQKITNNVVRRGVAFT